MKGKMQKAPVTVFSRFEQVARIRLPELHSFVILGRGTAPKGFRPESGAGTYEIDMQMLPGGSAMDLPIAIATIPSRHVAAWEKMPIEAVDSMMAAIEAETAGTRQ